MNIPNFWVGVRRQQGSVLKPTITKRKRNVKENTRENVKESIKEKVKKHIVKPPSLKNQSTKIHVKTKTSKAEVKTSDVNEEDLDIKCDVSYDEAHRDIHSDIHEEIHGENNESLIDDFVEVDSLPETEERIDRKSDIEIKNVNEMDEDTAHDALYNELRCSIKSSSEASVDRPLVLDSIISRQPYVKMMQNLFGAYDDSCFHRVDPVKIVTKSYEEMYMRECVEAGERPCAMGNNCECMFIDSNLPFTCVEFILPNEEPQPEPQLCVLCLRKLTQSMFYDVMYRHGKFNGIIQNHGNICEMPNEYSRKAMLICPPWGPVHCMPLPIVAHQRNRYSVYLDYMGVKHLKQHRVAFEDFQ